MRLPQSVLLRRCGSCIYQNFKDKANLEKEVKLQDFDLTTEKSLKTVC